VIPTRTLFPTWADTHSYTHTYTRTATCRTPGYIGVRTDVPTLTLTDTPLSNTNVRNPTVTARIYSLSGIRLFSV
jgi:hypothetical protein